MPSKPLNRNLHAAKAMKQDEFYTQLTDIEKELKNYRKHFKNKAVLCNCDDPRVSNFFLYFLNNFEKLKLKRLITTCYKNQQPDLFSKRDVEQGIYFEYCGDQENKWHPDPSKIKPRELRGDGDFRREECIGLLKQADIVVTNPPFSLFREYVVQLVKYKKKFIIIGPTNGITSKEIFSLIKRNKIWLGWGFDNGNAYFGTPYGDKYARGVYDPKTNLVKFRNVTWFTNLEHQKRHQELALYKPYNRVDYPTYDNYNAIEVSKTKDIPKVYDGIMGVPITFLERYNPEQFEIVGSDYEVKQGLLPKVLKRGWTGKTDRGYVKGKRLYARILIRWRTS